jgi:hypothetical protein
MSMSLKPLNATITKVSAIDFKVVKMLVMRNCLTYRLRGTVINWGFRMFTYLIHQLTTLWLLKKFWLFPTLVLSVSAKANTTLYILSKSKYYRVYSISVVCPPEPRTIIILYRFLCGSLRRSMKMLSTVKLAINIKIIFTISKIQFNEFQ